MFEKKLDISLSDAKSDSRLSHKFLEKKTFLLSLQMNQIYYKKFCFLDPLRTHSKQLQDQQHHHHHSASNLPPKLKSSSSQPSITNTSQYNVNNTSSAGHLLHKSHPHQHPSSLPPPPPPSSSNLTSTNINNQQNNQQQLKPHQPQTSNNQSEMFGTHHHGFGPGPNLLPPFNLPLPSSLHHHHSSSGMPPFNSSSHNSHMYPSHIPHPSGNNQGSKNTTSSSGNSSSSTSANLLNADYLRRELDSKFLQQGLPILPPGLPTPPSPHSQAPPAKPPLSHHHSSNIDASAKQHSQLSLEQQQALFMNQLLRNFPSGTNAPLPPLPSLPIPPKPSSSSNSSNKTAYTSPTGLNKSHTMPTSSMGHTFNSNQYNTEMAANASLFKQRRDSNSASANDDHVMAPQASHMTPQQTSPRSQQSNSSTVKCKNKLRGKWCTAHVRIAHMIVEMKKRNPNSNSSTSNNNLKNTGPSGMMNPSLGNNMAAMPQSQRMPVNPRSNPLMPPPANIHHAASAFPSSPFHGQHNGLPLPPKPSAASLSSHSSSSNNNNSASSKGTSLSTFYPPAQPLHHQQQSQQLHQSSTNFTPQQQQQQKPSNPHASHSLPMSNEEMILKYTNASRTSHYPPYPGGQIPAPPQQQSSQMPPKPMSNIKSSNKVVVPPAISSPGQQHQSKIPSGMPPMPHHMQQQHIITPPPQKRPRSKSPPAPGSSLQHLPFHQQNPLHNLHHMPPAGASSSSYLATEAAITAAAQQLLHMDKYRQMLGIPPGMPLPPGIPPPLPPSLHVPAIRQSPPIPASSTHSSSSSKPHSMIAKGSNGNVMSHNGNSVVSPKIDSFQKPSSKLAPPGMPPLFHSSNHHMPGNPYASHPPAPPQLPSAHGHHHNPHSNDSISPAATQHLEFLRTIMGNSMSASEAAALAAAFAANGGSNPFSSLLGIPQMPNQLVKQPGSTKSSSNSNISSNPGMMQQFIDGANHQAALNGKVPSQNSMNAPKKESKPFHQQPHESRFTDSHARPVSNSVSPSLSSHNHHNHPVPANSNTTKKRGLSRDDSSDTQCEEITIEANENGAPSRVSSSLSANYDSHAEYDHSDHAKRLKMFYSVENNLNNGLEIVNKKKDDENQIKEVTQNHRNNSDANEIQATREDEHSDVARQENKQELDDDESQNGNLHIDEEVAEQSEKTVISDQETPIGKELDEDFQSVNSNLEREVNTNNYENKDELKDREHIEDISSGQSERSPNNLTVSGCTPVATTD
jgi:hypothetical protein